jgi:hypothetical protein
MNALLKKDRKRLVNNTSHAVARPYDLFQHNYLPSSFTALQKALLNNPVISYFIITKINNAATCRCEVHRALQSKYKVPYVLIPIKQLTWRYVLTPIKPLKWQSPLRYDLRKTAEIATFSTF